MDLDLDYDISVYHIPLDHMLVIGVELDAILSLQNQGSVITIPFRQLMRHAKVHFRDVDHIAITTIENVQKMAEEVEAKNSLYAEFMEYIRLRTEKLKSEVIPLKKG